MRMNMTCIECVLKSVIKNAQTHAQGQQRQEELARRLLLLVAKTRWDLTPPDFAGLIHQELCDYLQPECDDFLAAEKAASTQLAWQLLEELSGELATMPDRFLAALHLVLGGNIIDFGVNADFSLAQAKVELHEVFDLPLDLVAAEELRKRMVEAKSIFYLLDNCGEAVFDRLLIEQFADKITLGVRGGPIYNDITLAELAESGLDGYPVITSGAQVPGASLLSASEEFKEHLRTADLVVAKGQGNFEALGESVLGPTFFLFRCKCPVVCKYLNDAPMGSLQIIGRALNEA